MSSSFDDLVLKDAVKLQGDMIVQLQVRGVLAGWLAGWLRCVFVVACLSLSFVRQRENLKMRDE